MDPEMVRLQWDSGQFTKRLGKLSKEEKERKMRQKFSELELKIICECIKNFFTVAQSASRSVCSSHP
jgi:hypothetical protein